MNTTTPGQALDVAYGNFDSRQCRLLTRQRSLLRQAGQ